MNKLYTIDRNFNYTEEEFSDHVEATNRAKAQSLRAYCSILQNTNGKVFFFENGESCGAKRVEELSSVAYEILVSKMEKDVAIARGKRNKKKS
mgnify:CR=1 FL=1